MLLLFGAAATKKNDQTYRIQVIIVIILTTELLKLRWLMVFSLAIP
jgi:hypothetical protein